MFDDMIADMESNKKLSPKVTELFLSGRKLNISFFFHSFIYLFTFIYIYHSLISKYLNYTTKWNTLSYYKNS